MNDFTRRRLNALKDAKQFEIDHPLVPANAKATAEYTGIGAAITAVETLDSTRFDGTGTFRGASAQRQALRQQLHSALRDLSKAAETLDATAHPDVAAKLRIGRSNNSYVSLLSFARHVVTTITPIKQVFIDLGAAATVVEDLEALITALEGAGSRQSTGLFSQVGKTAGLEIEIRKGMLHLRNLDAILCQVYKSDPALLTAWKAVRRVESAPAPAGPSAPPVEPPPESGS